ncbi:MAG: hypothetical protein IPJ66_10550 [Bacteroidetes bacterium]|nr:hypothetical protein [Bacteroidota bacterium]
MKCKIAPVVFFILSVLVLATIKWKERRTAAPERMHPLHWPIASNAVARTLSAGVGKRRSVFLSFTVQM